MKRNKLIGLALMVIALVMMTTAPVKADTYQYVGVIENGHTYNGTGVAKFQMTDGYTAFCVDVNTNRNYIGFELDKHYCEVANERIQKAMRDKAVGE